MKVILINGSPHAHGCTYTGLSIIGEKLAEHGIDSEIIQVGTKPVSGCIACMGCAKAGRCVLPDDGVNAAAAKVRDADGLIPKVIREGEPVMHISDWPYSSIDEEGDALFVENAYLLMGLGRLAEISSLLNRPGDHAYWLAEHTRLAGAIRNAFFDPEAGLFRDTPVSEKHHPGVNALAAEAGLFRTGELAGAMKYLASAPYETRVILSWNYLKTLFENGCRQKAFDLLADPSARWGLMASQGSKTIWEGFEDIESHSHAWNCYPLRLLQEYIAGIRCAAPGFTETEITPFFPEGLYEFSARVCAAGGVIEVQGWRSETGAKFQVELPEGVSGVFRYGEVEQPLEEGLTEVEITL